MLLVLCLRQIEHSVTRPACMSVKCNYKLFIEAKWDIDTCDIFSWVVCISTVVILRWTEFLNHCHTKVMIDTLNQNSY